VTLNYFLALVPAVAMLASLLVQAPQQSSRDYRSTT